MKDGVTTATSFIWGLYAGTRCGSLYMKTIYGCPDFPWHSVDDLQQALGLNRAARKFFLHKLRSANWGNIARTIATDYCLLDHCPALRGARTHLGSEIQAGCRAGKLRPNTALPQEASKLFLIHLQFPDERRRMQFMQNPRRIGTRTLGCAMQTRTTRVPAGARPDPVKSHGFYSLVPYSPQHDFATLRLIRSPLDWDGPSMGQGSTLLSCRSK